MFHALCGPTMGRLPEGIRGAVPWELIHNKPFFEWLEEHPKENLIFSKAMNGASSMGETMLEERC